MDHYSHDQVYSSIDRHGRYAYNGQPEIGLWNLTRFAESILPLLGDDTGAAIEAAQAVLNSYTTRYERNWLDGMRAKIGLQARHRDDRALIEDLLGVMDAHGADFTLTFYYLSLLQAASTEHDGEVRALFDNPEAFDRWARQWRARLHREGSSDATRRTQMLAVNPALIPRNHRIEAAIRAAEDHGDFSMFLELHAVLQNPRECRPGEEAYLLPPEPDEVVRQTFCGT
jgi:uncharacterized protein YdiU (UPF0061 family)